MTDQQELVQVLHEGLGLELPEKISLEKLKEELSRYIDHCIQNDFQKLISFLYRVDVSEPKLRSLLKENPGTDAGLIIAELIIERQLQKIKSRQEFRQRDNDMEESEKW